MKITFSNNPISKLSCYIHNKFEDVSRVCWLIGKHKKIKCHICGNVLDSWHDIYSPIQCGWQRISKYRWICHKCMEHRDFKKYISQIDEDERKMWEERCKHE